MAYILPLLEPQSVDPSRISILQITEPKTASGTTTSMLKVLLFGDEIFQRYPICVYAMVFHQGLSFRVPLTAQTNPEEVLD